MKVLIAEDDPVSRRVLESTLTKWGYEVVICSNGTEAWAALQKEDSPQLAILDWMMPGMDGIQVCREIRGHAGAPYTYVLLLTARAQKEDLVAGMEAGADDYLTKPFDAQELKVRVRAGQRILELQTELIRAREALRIQATHDPLTGLFNRGVILNILERELDRAKRQKSPVGLILLDLDHFKNVNDTYGHLAGDEVLREAGRRLRESMRSYDSMGRYGGEEFLLVAPGLEVASAKSVAERLRASLAREPVKTSAVSVPVTCSLGVVVSEAGDEMVVENLVRAADTALYQAKRAGRNRVEILKAD